MPPSVLILILNYQQPELTNRLLASCSDLSYPNFAILVVDNGSEDNSVELIYNHHPGVRIYCHPTNSGFSGGVNTGLKVALADGVDYVLMLNNDTLVASSMLDTLVGVAKQHQVAVTAPLIYYENKPDTVWSAGAFRQKLTGDIRQNLRNQTIQMTAPYYVDYATACGLLVRCDVWRDVGLFDEQFFMYYEDLDWCWRLQQTNHRIMVVPEAKMWHRVAATIGGSDSPDERYHMARSSVLFFRKHTTGWQWPVVLSFRLFSALKTSWRLNQNSKAVIKYWQGLWDGLRA